jgi:hypothetical protein
MNGSMNGNAPGTVELRQRPMPRQCRHPERRVTPDYPNVEMCDRCCGGLTLAQWYWDERNG